MINQILLPVSIIFLSLSLSIPVSASSFDEGLVSFAIEQTVYKVRVEDGVSPSDVQLSILSKGSELNMKFVSHQPLSEELQARGVETGQIDIFQFCNPMDARQMIDANIIFVAYMPCRIALVEDKNNQLWLMMIDLDMIINNTKLSEDIKKLADLISSKLKIIIDAARLGEF